MALFLLCAVGLARLQTGGGQAHPDTPTDRKYEMPQPESVGRHRSIEIETPARWVSVDSPPGRFVWSDPQKPTRSLTLQSASADEAASPALAAQQFFEQHLGATAHETIKLAEPMGFTLEETGLSGVQFIGTRTGEDGSTQSHLLACLTLKGRYAWWVYLTDTVDAGGDEQEVMRANVWLLKSVYSSIRIVED